MSAVIDRFDGSYRFLSNFYPAYVRFAGQTYPSVENAYQAAKFIDPTVREKFENIGPGLAKSRSRNYPIRSDWDFLKNSIMLDLVQQKFSRWPALRMALLETGEAQLIEGNTWGDEYWGVCNGCGANNLGRILMYVRAVLRAENEYLTFKAFTNMVSLTIPFEGQK